MSRVIKGISFFVILMLFTAVILTVHGRSVREHENTNALADAIETSLTSVMEQKAYTIENSREFVADLLQTLLARYRSDSEITVKVVKQDKEKGLLSVEVDEAYRHPNGKKGTVSVQRTVVFDKKQTGEARTCRIRFYLTKTDLEEEDGSGANCYKSYTLIKGDNLIRPENPVLAGHRFTAWKRADGSTVNFSKKAEGDVSLYAFAE